MSKEPRRNQANDRNLTELSRRDLLRSVGVAGVGALGLGLVGCTDRPGSADSGLTNDPQVLQAGGTLSGRLAGLLGGAAAAGVTVNLVGLGEVVTDALGQFEVRVAQSGEFRVQLSGRGFHARSGVIRIDGNLAIDELLLENDAGVPMRFIDQYARATGPNGKEGVVPRTPGATNRWTRPPRVNIYRKLADNSKLVVPDARITALRGAVAALFAPLTGSRLGFPSIEVLPGQPPRNLGSTAAGVMVISQSQSGALATSNGSSLSDVYDINKALVGTRLDAPIELFNRAFAHGLGGYVVSNQFASILNGAGRATPSTDDVQAATFLYSRVPGNSSPDQDPDGVFIGA